MPHRLNKNNELLLSGGTGFVDFNGNGFTAAEVVGALAEIKGDLNVRLNSGGGIATEGVAIFNAIKSRSGRKTIFIDAIAASAASVIAMAGTEIVMRQGALMMLHNASGLTIGTRADHDKQSSVLAKIDGEMAGIYASRSGKPITQVQRMMDEETWLDGAEAVEEGLATRAEKTGAAITASAFDYSSYRHAPGELVALAQNWKGAGQPLAAWAAGGVAGRVPLTPPEKFAAEFHASADLQAEFLSVEGYVALRVAEGEGRAHAFRPGRDEAGVKRGRRQSAVDQKAAALRGKQITKAQIHAWAAEFAGSAEIQAEFRTPLLYCAFLNGNDRGHYPDVAGALREIGL